MKIKTLAVTSALALLTSTAVRAADKVVVEDGVTTSTGATGESWWESHTYYERENKPLFHANEVSLDLFGSYIAAQRNFTDLFDTNIRHGNWGGGVGLNYFATPYVGVSAETAFYTGTRNFANHVLGSLQLRLPIEAAHLAPYAFGGGGYYFNPRDQWGVHGGIGLEFKLNPHTGIFGDARYVWLDKSPDDAIIFRSGLRVGF